jgi:hypothetical protein
MGLLGRIPHLTSHSKSTFPNRRLHPCPAGVERYFSTRTK